MQENEIRAAAKELTEWNETPDMAFCPRHEKALSTLISLASLWLSAGESLPPKRITNQNAVMREEPQAFRDEGFNSCHDIAQAVIARKEARIKELEAALERIKKECHKNPSESSRWIISFIEQISRRNDGKQ
jgi:hypothetical protein